MRRLLILAPPPRRDSLRGALFDACSDGARPASVECGACGIRCAPIDTSGSVITATAGQRQILNDEAQLTGNGPAGPLPAPA